MRGMIFLTMLVLLVSAVSAGTFDMKTELRETLTQLSERGMYDLDLLKDILIMKKKFVGNYVPLAFLFGDDRIKLNVLLDSGKTLDLCIAIDGGIITSLEVCEDPFYPSAIASTTNQVMDNIEGDDESIITALQNDQITFEAVGWRNKIKYSALVFV